MAPQTLPSGVVTLLFADIEGSTQLWERSPQAMRQALAEHDAILNAAIAHHNGVVFKTVGDAFHSAFAHPRDGLDAAIEIQRSLRAHEWPPEVGEIRVRIGLHTGECVERDRDYFGPTVNRLARFLALGYGEQVLVSSATATLLGDQLDDSVALRNLGTYRLRDLGQPEPMYQVLAQGLRPDFPALTSFDSRPNNLPSQRSSFIGRSDELTALARMVSETRLLTITGPGGIGKTRVALQLAANVIERYADGAWFVELTAIRNPEFVAQAIATALHLRELPSESIEQTLIAHLRARSLLLVIDNAEQVLPGAAKIVKLILSQCPNVTIVTTTREPLHLAGEQSYRLGPLADSMRLFLERARQAAPFMTIGETESADIAALCKKLEGIPLAIELACARLSSMPLKQLAKRLSSGLTLASKDSTETSRHRTLRETIAWSYDLLAPGEQGALNDLSIFRGSCNIDAIHGVAGEISDLDEAVESLVDKSLLLLDLSGDEGRYRMLDVVRSFARERLVGTNGYDDAARKHAAYYSALAAEATRAHGDQRELHLAIDRDAPNMQAALEWSIAHDARNGARLIRDLAPYWRVRGSVTEARSWIASILEALGEDEPDRAALLCVAASFATLQDDLAESLRFSNEALAISRRLGDGAGSSQALFRIAEVEHRKGRLDETEAFYREALRGFGSSRDARGEVLCLGNLGMLARQRGDLREASKLLEDAIQRSAQLGEERISGEFTMAMGWVRLDLNELEQSRMLFESVFALKSQAQDAYGVCCAHHGLGTVALREGRLRDALDEFLATLHGATELRLKDYVARAFHGIAAILALRGEPEPAAQCLGFADRLFEESGRVLRDSVAYDVAAQAIEAVVPQPRAAQLRGEGARIPVSDAIAAVIAATSRPSSPD